MWRHVYPLGFVGAAFANAGQPLTHRLGQLGDWLDDAVNNRSRRPVR